VKLTILGLPNLTQMLP